MRRGFTLIELLVVIAIIAILASILFPVFSRAREKARQTACLSNIKQISLGVIQYAQDYDEGLPPFKYVVGDPVTGYVSYWPNTLMPYLKNTQILVCPSHRIELSDSSGLRLDLTEYGWNCGVYETDITSGALDTGLGPWGNAVSLSQIANDSETILLGEANRSSYPNPYNEPYSVYVVESPYTYLAGRHNEGGNYAFCDGHAKWYNKTTLKGRLFTLADD